MVHNVGGSYSLFFEKNMLKEEVRRNFENCAIKPYFVVGFFSENGGDFVYVFRSGGKDFYPLNLFFLKENLLFTASDQYKKIDGNTLVK